MNASDLRLIHIAFEDHIAHICHRSNRGTIVEIVRLNHRVSHLYGNIENHTGDGAANLCRTGDIGVLGDAVANDLQRTLRIVSLLDRLQVVCPAHVKILLGNHPLLEKLLVPLVGFLHLFQRDLRHIDPALGAIQLHHLRNHLDGRDNLSLLHHLTGLLAQLGNDARDLRFDLHLVARLHISRRDRLGNHRVSLGRNDLIHRHNRL